MKRLLAKIFGRPRDERVSLLRQLVDVDAFRKDPAKALLNAALQVRRSGLEHLVTEASPSEALALAAAGEAIAEERIAQLLVALADPPQALEPIDGGAALRHSVLREALAEVRLADTRGKRRN